LVITVGIRRSRHPSGDFAVTSMTLIGANRRLVPEWNRMFSPFASSGGASTLLASGMKFGIATFVTD
jgi:hypothetical protein